MNHAPAWGWVVLFFLGAYHGMNPGMGWLFAVALGMQKQSGRVVWQSLVPIALGHALAIGVVVAGAVIETLDSLDLAYPKVDEGKLKELSAAKKKLLSK